MPLKKPPNYQSTSTMDKLSGGPMDMPDRGGPKTNVHPRLTSSTVSLGRKESPVAAFGARPGMGEVQCSSTKSTLSRMANSPYGNTSETKPQVSMKKGKGK